MREIEVTFTAQIGFEIKKFTVLVPLNLIPIIGEYVKIPMIGDPDEFYKVSEVCKSFYGDNITLEVIVR